MVNHKNNNYSNRVPGAAEGSKKSGSSSQRRHNKSLHHSPETASNSQSPERSRKPQLVHEPLKDCRSLRKNP